MPGTIDVEALIKKLSVNEKIDLLTGLDYWHTRPLPEHGIPSIRLSDGPNGVRGTKFFDGVKAACFPCGTALGAAFNTTLLEEAGRKMGEETKLKGAHCLLSPAINMQRAPVCGRGFESIGEDPILAGLGAAALCRGIESTEVLSTPKHWICNDQEHRRNAVLSIVTERALREIYALPFQLTMRDADPGAIMTGYNGLNNAYCSENRDILDTILRKEWGWKGMIMSDWYGTYSTNDAVNAGLDLEMPGPSKFRGDLLKFNVATDKINEHTIDERARPILNFVKKAMALGIPENAPETTDDSPETAELLRRIGGETLVLLKNDRNIVTYQGGGSAAVPAYYAITPFDGISQKLESPPCYAAGAYTNKLLPPLANVTKTASGEQGMTMKAYTKPPGTENRVVVDDRVLSRSEMLLSDYYNEKIEDKLWYAEFVGSSTAEEDCEFELGLIVCGSAKLFVNDELIIDNATKQRQGDAFLGTATVEEKSTIPLKKGETYNFRVEFASSPSSKLKSNNTAVGSGALRIGGCKVINAEEEIARAAALAKDADQVIICAGLNADWETEGYDRETIGLPGLQDELISTVAKANPNTIVVNQSGTPVTMPWLDNIAGLVQAWYGGNETGNVIADVLFGDVNPSGKLPLTFPRRLQDNPTFLNFRAESSRTLYGEDIYIGYRFYEFADRAVLFPFSHGLSYTSFSFSDISVAAVADGKLTVEVTVRNTGAVRGAEVVQVYVAPSQQARVNRPIKELKGFTKVALEPGQSERVTVEALTKYDAAAYWDESRHKWCVEADEYEVIVSDSSTISDKAVRGSFKIDETYWWIGL
ncbi:beta-glucosidase I like protein [Verticillium longisporum]|uniref:Probable beta-glucosidase I n=1 Tax=Verticillium longisporum TaxID=100787 RepID=A0A8I3ALJ8_VERLO|nr:beta-glucosidase I like protein [Verticillium longisporum]